MIDVAMTQAVGSPSACVAGISGSASSTVSEDRDFRAVLCAAGQEDQPAAQADATDGGASSGAAVVDMLLARFLGQLPLSPPVASEVQATGAEAPAVGDATVSVPIQMAGAAVADTNSVDGHVGWQDDGADMAAGADGDTPEATLTAQDARATASPGTEAAATRTTSEAAAHVAALRRDDRGDAPRAADAVAAVGQEGRSVNGDGPSSRRAVLLGPNSRERGSGQAEAEMAGAASDKEGGEAPSGQASFGSKAVVEAVISQAQPTAGTDQSSHVATEASVDSVAAATTQVTDRSVPVTVSQRPELRHPEDTALRERVIEQVVREVRLTRLPERSDLVVRLNPPELGTLRVHIAQDAQGISSQIIASTEQVRHLLQANVPALVEALTQAGVRMDSVNVASDVSFGAFMDGSTQGSDYQRPGGQPRGHSQAGPMLGALTLGSGSPTSADSAAYSWLA